MDENEKKVQAVYAEILLDKKPESVPDELYYKAAANTLAEKLLKDGHLKTEKFKGEDGYLHYRVEGLFITKK
jgi:hypothetical protein